MKNWVALGLLSLVLVICLIVVGCGSPVSSPATTPASTPASTSPKPAIPATSAQSVTPTISPKYGGILKRVTGNASNVFGYSPLISFSGYADSSPALESLLSFNGEGRPQPRLAKDFKINPDGKSVTLSLREGVKFHDDTECDATAVKWNIEQFQAEKARFGQVVSIDIVDKYTVRLNMNSFSNSLIYDLVMGLMMSPTAFSTNGKEWTFTHPIGTGPFKFVSYDRNTLLKFAKFDGYWQKGRPYLDGLEISYIADNTVRSMAFTNKSADILLGPNLQDVSKMKQNGFTVRPTVAGVHSLYPDTANPGSIFNNEKVRQAIEYAIDREAIGKLGYGYYNSVNQAVHSSRMAYVPDLAARSYNPDKAKQLLSEAGLPNINTKIIASVIDDNDVLVAIQSFLAAVGIKAELEVTDFGKFMNYYNKGWKDALVFWIIPAEENSLDGLNNQLNPKSNFAVSLNKPPELGQLLAKADAATDFNSLKADCQAVVKYVYDQTLFIPVYADYNCTVEQPYVMDANINSPNLFRLYWTPENAWLNK